MLSRRSRPALLLALVVGPAVLVGLVPAIVGAFDGDGVVTRGPFELPSAGVELAPQREAQQPGIVDPTGADPPEVGPAGGTVDLPSGFDLVVPAGAVPAASRFSRHSVELRLEKRPFPLHAAPAGGPRAGPAQ